MTHKNRDVKPSQSPSTVAPEVRWPPPPPAGYRVEHDRLGIVRAIAAVMTAAAKPETPYTEAEVLSDALSVGLLSLERQFLGTRSSDPYAPWEDDAAPETTPMMLALVHALEAPKKAAARASKRGQGRRS
jgi:hypothetical protein